MAIADRYLSDGEELVHVVRRHRTVLIEESTAPAPADHRLMTRDGLISRQGRDMPPSRVDDAAFGMSVWERIMRYGTLTVQSASEQEAVTPGKVPRPEWFQSEIYRRVSDAHRPQTRSDLR
ncbi:PH domain-containing protein [Nocardiopsis flavescens]